MLAWSPGSPSRKNSRLSIRVATANGVEGKIQRVKYKLRSYIRRVAGPDFLLVFGGLILSMSTSVGPGQKRNTKKKEDVSNATGEPG